LTRFVAGLLSLAFLSGARPSAAARVEPPVARATPAPLAPDGTIGEPVVVLELIVAQDGKVTSAVVVEGEAPFAELARAAALEWRFDPATRDGAPVSAKIRMRVELRRRPRNETPAAESEAPDAASPAVPSADAAPDAGSPPQVAPPAPAEAPQDVIVRGGRPLAPHVQLLASEVREIPGAFGDAFRALEALPGVVPIVSGLPYFVIRGALPGNTGFFVDGIRVPGLFHFGVGEAVFSPGLIEKVDLFPGVYPAHFGRFAGGILSGDAVPPADKLHGDLTVRLLDTGAFLETPFANGRGDALVAGRYGYPGLLLSVADPNVGLQYWDYQARAGYRFADGSYLGVFTFGSYDSVSSRPDNTDQPLQKQLGVEFERVSVRYTRPTHHSGEVRIEMTAGRDRTETGSSTPLTLNSQIYSLAGSWTFHPDEATRVRVGADLVFEPYRFDFGLAPGNADTGPLAGVLPAAQNDLTAGAYAELETKLSSRVSTEVGARMDLFTASYPGLSASNPATQSREVPAFDPRLTMRYAVSSNVSVISAIGMAHQASNIPFPIPALTFSQLGRGLQTAYQASEGVEVTLPLGFSGSATVFGNEFVGLAQLDNNCISGTNAACVNQTVHGQSYGLELLIRRSLTAKLSGWLAYTLSRAERDSFNGTTGLWGHQLSEFDRTHVVNLIGAYDLGRNWRAGARVVAYTGWPYSTMGFGSPPNARMPPFYRLDVRLEKKWPESWGHVAFVAEWLNVLLNKEDIGVTTQNCPPGQTYCPQSVGPISVPSLGVEIGF
jgi:TonB family protein